MGIVDLRDEGTTSLEMARILLAGVPGGLQKAVKSATPRAASHLRSESNKAIKMKYAAGSGVLSKHGESRAKYVMNDESVSADILFTGRKIPLIDFDGSGPKTSDVWDKSHKNWVFIKGRWKYRWPGIAAVGHQYKGGAKSLGDAFVGKVRAGSGSHIGIFSRTGGMTAANSDKIHQLMGDAPPQMIANPEVLDPLSRTTADKFQERMDHEVVRLLNGWGGR